MLQQDIISHLREQFPILERSVHDRPLVYLDTAATAQKPKVVIDAIASYYSVSNSNVHRGAHALAAEATGLYEDARHMAAMLLHAARMEEVVFTKGTTEGINLVASAWGAANVGNDDEVLVTYMEHHANIVPWQMLCERTGATLRVVPIHDDGSLDMDACASMMNERTRMVAVTHVSNTLGTVNDVAAICAMARRYGAATLVDGAQAVPHVAVDVQAIGCDFYVFSAHKLYGPTGFGILYGRYDVLNAMPPYQGGGSMISRVSFEKTTYNDVPMRFEAGTPHIAGAAGLAAAIRWFMDIDHAMLLEHERELTTAATTGLTSIDGLRIIGNAPGKLGIVSFVVDGVHAHDIGTLIDAMGVAIRTGHHCTQPLMERFGVTSTARASFACHTTREEVDILVDSVNKAVRMLR